MVSDAGQYPWSSYRYNGLGQADECLTPHAEYLSLGRTDHERQATYRSLFRAELDEAAVADIRLAMAQGQPFGNSQFSVALCQAAGVRQTHARRGRPTKPSSDGIGIDGKQTGFGV